MKNQTLLMLLGFLAVGCGSPLDPLSVIRGSSDQTQSVTIDNQASHELDVYIVVTNTQASAGCSPSAKDETGAIAAGTTGTVQASISCLANADDTHEGYVSIYDFHGTGFNPIRLDRANLANSVSLTGTDSGCI